MGPKNPVAIVEDSICFSMVEMLCYLRNAFFLESDHVIS
jgi:hypothetical protein